MLDAGASFHTLGLQSSVSVPSGDMSVAACCRCAMQGDAQTSQDMDCRLHSFPQRLLPSLFFSGAWKCCQ